MESPVHKHIVSDLRDEYSTLTLALNGDILGRKVDDYVEEKYGEYPEEWREAAAEDARKQAREKLRENITTPASQPTTQTTDYSVSPDDFSNSEPLTGIESINITIS